MSSRLERRILEALRPVSESVWKPFNTAVAATKRRPKNFPIPTFCWRRFCFDSLAVTSS
jgi:hypothetical protein